MTCACQALMGPNTHTRPVISSSFCVVTCTNIDSAIQMRLRFTVCCTIISTSWRKNRPLWYIYRLQKLFHYHSYLMILVSLISMNIGWDSLLLFTSPLGVNPCRSTDPLKAGRGRATVPFLRMRTKKNGLGWILDLCGSATVIATVCESCYSLSAIYSWPFLLEAYIVFCYALLIEALQWCGNFDTVGVVRKQFI